MNSGTVALLTHAAIVVALVIAGAVTGDHSLIDAGLAYGAGTGAAAALPARPANAPPGQQP